MIDTDIVQRMKDGHLVQHYLLASYAYYVLDESPMTDAAYDRLCARLLERFAAIQHQHKHLIDADSLSAGSGYAIPHDAYPGMVVAGVYDYLARCRNGTILALLEPHLLPAGSAPPTARRISRRPQAAPAPVVRRITRAAPLQVPTAPAPEVKSTGGAVAATRRIVRRR